MLINEVDAIPQRNCLNLSDLKKRRGSTQANTATKLYTLDAFRGKNAQYTQQNKENRRVFRISLFINVLILILVRKKMVSNCTSVCSCWPLNGWECTMITPFTTCEWVNSVIPPR